MTAKAKKTITKTIATPSVKLPTTPFEVGQAYFFRTVTYHLTGRVTAVVGDFLMLEKAAWIADSGRFMQTLRNGRLNEVEPCGEAIINTASITDAFPWKHALPENQK